LGSANDNNIKIKGDKREKIHTTIYIGLFAAIGYIQFLTNKPSSTTQTTIVKYIRLFFRFVPTLG